MNRWRVWFADQPQPVEVETDENTPALAIGVASDCLKLDSKTTPHLVRVEHVEPTDGRVVQAWPKHDVTRSMWRWRVWFHGRVQPCEVVTEVKLPMYAIATALDMIHVPARAHMRVSRVELLDGAT